MWTALSMNTARKKGLAFTRRAPAFVHLPFESTSLSSEVKKRRTEMLLKVTTLLYTLVLL